MAGGLFASLVSAGVRELVGGTVGAVVGGITTVKVEQARAATDKNKVDRETGRDISIQDMRTSERFAELHATLALADRADRRMAWVRPYFCALSAWYVGSFVLQATMPKVAAFLLIEPVALPVFIQVLILGIPGAVLVLRPGEKQARAETVTAAQANIVQAQTAARGKIGIMRRDDAP